MKKALFILLSCVSLIAIADDVGPQRQPPSPEEMRKMMDASMGAVVPMMAKMTDAMLEVILKKGEEPSTAQRIARFKRNLYEALLKEGFSKQQALLIAASSSIPAAAPMK
jgi:hypothetical protein